MIFFIFLSEKFLRNFRNLFQKYERQKVSKKISKVFNKIIFHTNVIMNNNISNKNVILQLPKWKIRYDNFIYSILIQLYIIHNEIGIFYVFWVSTLEHINTCINIYLRTSIFEVILLTEWYNSFGYNHLRTSILKVILSIGSFHWTINKNIKKFRINSINFLI